MRQPCALGKKFTSFKKVVRDMGYGADSKFAIVSMHSTSKGFYGECGRRGGYIEVCGFDPKVKDELYKLSSVGLCPNLGGQITMVGLYKLNPVDLQLESAWFHQPWIL
jgi:alanine transaminase